MFFSMGMLYKIADIEGRVTGAVQVSPECVNGLLNSDIMSDVMFRAACSTKYLLRTACCARDIFRLPPKPSRPQQQPQLHRQR